jgi:N-acetylglucosamine-6-phosphate deacetylase
MNANMKRKILTNLKIYGETGTIQNGYILIEENRIGEIGSMDELDIEISRMEVFDFDQSGYCCIPGMIDLHIHGVAGADTMDGTLDALMTMAMHLPQEGTTGFLATTITQSVPQIEQALQNVATHIDQVNATENAEILGVHLEGPFISPKRAGAQPLHAILDPDVELFQRWQQMAGGHIRLVTLAPEREGGLELTRALAGTGVIASIGHSDATYEEVMEGIRAGITHVTHLFNGMRGLHHREPGVAGAALLHDELYAEVIADGIHVHPKMVKLAYEKKGRERLILITDAMRAKCLGSGVYDLGQQQVIVTEDRATLADGTLAGSILLMRDAMLNMISFADCTLEDVIHLTSVNPAKELGIFNRKGSIARGKDADLVVLNQNYEVVMTFCRGNMAYSSLNKNGSKTS